MPPGRGLTRRELLAAGAAAAVLPELVAELVGSRSGRRPPGGWLAGDLHCHTTYSADVARGRGGGGHTPGEQIALAESRGLDFLAITDHDGVASLHAPDYISDRLVLVPGYEHTLSDADHAGVFMPSRDLLSGIVPSTGGTRAWLGEIHARGGMAVVNHPFFGVDTSGDSLTWDRTVADTMLFDAVEVWNALWLTQFADAEAHRAIGWWESTVARPAVGASDNHWKALDGTAGVGQPTTWVYVPSRSAAGVIAGVRAGRTSVSSQPPRLGGAFVTLDAVEEWSGRAATTGGAVGGEGPLLAVVTMRNARGHRLRLVSGGTDVVHESPVASDRVEVPLVLPPRGHLRAELLLAGRDALTAFTSCVYASGRAPTRARREPTRGRPLTYDGRGFA